MINCCSTYNLINESGMQAANHTHIKLKDNIILSKFHDDVLYLQQKSEPNLEETRGLCGPQAFNQQRYFNRTSFESGTSKKGTS